MKHRVHTLRGFAALPAVAVAAAMLVGQVTVEPALAEQPATTLQTLLDKQQIQDMLVDYYTNLGKGKSDFGSYYVADGVINVNGLKGQGEAAITEVYKKVAAGSPKRSGVFRMLLSNVIIVINGSTANAETIWTGIESPNKADPPQFAEQGTEHSELVKVNGKWLFKLRVITSNAGLQPMFAKLPKE